MSNESKQRLFIYDRKELIVLVLLGGLVAVFAFTLGVHLGKRSGLFRGDQATQGDVAPVGTIADKAPNRQELNEQAKGVPQAVDESLNQALHEEVQRVGIRLATPRPIDLPEKTKSASGGETAPAARPVSGTEPPAAVREALTQELKKEAAVTGKAEEPHAAPAAHNAPVATAPAAAAAPAKHSATAATSRFALQVGSFPTLGEAQAIRDSLESHGLSPAVRSAEIPGKGTWYRVFVGSYTTKEEAEQLGARYQTQKFFKSFIVTNLSE